MKITVAPGVRINREELTFTFACSGGPGGQNVNKVNTAATLWFDLAGSPSLTEDQKARIGGACRGRINAEGRLYITCREFRTQLANRRAAVRRFEELLTAVLRPRPRRKATRPSRAARERRLATKRKNSLRKQERGGRFGGPE